ncbi:MAG TPA: serine/threonine-protein kinase [Ktedonobacteraceae bacterium]|nr:serine/threonine-protein kinase [Ktedonobacteraceae bacterium]
MMERTGQQLGNYRLVSRLGRGGAAEVYLGEHIFLTTQAAIKVLLTSLSEPDMAAFLREARTIAGLTHPHIVRVLDFGVQDEILYLVMEYAPGGTLRQSYPQGSRLSQSTVVALVGQIAEALQYAHNQHIIHCDVKPENILLSKEKAVLLSDFGIARMLQTVSVQQAQHIAGTLAYMAPEQFSGKPRQASDQYALAVMAYEWLSGERPFRGSIAEISSQHLHALAAPLSEKVPDMPAAVDEVLRIAMEKDPERRFGSILAFARALEQACAIDPAQAQADYAENGPTILAMPGAAPLPPASAPASSQARELPFHPLTATVASDHMAALRHQTDPQRFTDPSALQSGASDQLQPGSLVVSQPPRALPKQTSRRTFLVGAGGGAVVVGVLVGLLASGRLTALFAHGTTTPFSTPQKNTPLAQRARTPTRSSTPAGPPIGTTLAIYHGHSDEVTGVCWSPLPGRTVASCSLDGSVAIWDVTADNLPLTHTQSGEIYTVAWSPDGRWLASAGSAAIIEIWDATSNNVLARCLGHSQSIFGLAWSPDSQRLVSASQDRQAIVWQAAGGNRLATFSEHSDTVWTAAWSSDGSAIATGGLDGKVAVWSPDNGSAMAFYDAQSPVRAVDWSPDGSLIAFGSDDAQVRLWEHASGTIQTTYRGHRDHIEAVQWSHTGHLIASASADTTAQIWQPTSAAPIYTYTGHTQKIWTLAWSPDSQVIVTGSADTTTRIWQAV